MGFEIRTARTEDAARVCSVLRRSITECCVQDHRDDAAILAGWLGNKTPDNVTGWISSPSNHMLVALRGDELVGVALVTQAGKLSLCYLVPEAQHAGIGKALLAGVESQARAWGISVLRLHSTGTAHDFFARHGYVLAGKEKSCYGVECDFFWKKLGAEQAADAAQATRFCACSAQ